MYILMGATANTILSGIGGFILGVVGTALWFARESRKFEGYHFDERDIYSKPPLKKVL